MSQSAVAILVDPPGAVDRVRALSAASSKPALFAELHKQFDGQVPSADNLHAHLQKQGFTASAASSAGRAYRDTMALVNGEIPAQTSPADVPPPKADGGKEEPMVGDETATRESLKMRISKDCMVSLNFEGPVTQGAIGKLIAKLEISKDEYPIGE